jgi:hypothetical protein
MECSFTSVKFSTRTKLAYILDIMMSSRTGFDLTKHLKSIGYPDASITRDIGLLRKLLSEDGCSLEYKRGKHEYVLVGAYGALQSIHRKLLPLPDRSPYSHRLFERLDSLSFFIQNHLDYQSVSSSSERVLGRPTNQRSISFDFPDFNRDLNIWIETIQVLRKLLRPYKH